MMKNLILLFLIVGTTILSQAQTQVCCDPCPPECCVAVCDANTSALKTSLQQMSIEDDLEVSTRKACQPVSRAACVTSKTQASAEVQVTNTRTIESLPQIVAVVQSRSLSQSLTPQNTALYKGEQ